MAPHAAFKNRKSRNAVESMALTAEVYVSYDCCIFKTEQIFQNSVKFNAMQSSWYGNKLKVMRQSAVCPRSPKKNNAGM